jgi:hypothetical protein
VVVPDKLTSGNLADLKGIEQTFRSDGGEPLPVYGDGRQGKTR